MLLRRSCSSAVVANAACLQPARENVKVTILYYSESKRTLSINIPELQGLRCSGYLIKDRTIYRVDDSIHSTCLTKTVKIKILDITDNLVWTHLFSFEARHSPRWLKGKWLGTLEWQPPTGMSSCHLEGETWDSSEHVFGETAFTQKRKTRNFTPFLFNAFSLNNVFCSIYPIISSIT